MPKEFAVRCALFCEELRQEDDGRLSVISIFHTRFLTGDVPEGMVTGLKLNVAFLLLLECPPGPYEVVMTFVTPAGKRTPHKATVSVDASTAGLRVPARFSFSDVTGKEMGPWSLEVTIGRKLIVRVPLRVSYRYRPPITH